MFGFTNVIGYDKLKARIVGGNFSEVGVVGIVNDQEDTLMRKGVYRRPRKPRNEFTVVRIVRKALV